MEFGKLARNQIETVETLIKKDKSDLKFDLIELIEQTNLFCFSFFKIHRVAK